MLPHKLCLLITAVYCLILFSQGQKNLGQRLTLCEHQRNYTQIVGSLPKSCYLNGCDPPRCICQLKRISLRLCKVPQVLQLWNQYSEDKESFPSLQSWMITEDLEMIRGDAVSVARYSREISQLEKIVYTLKRTQG